MLVPTIPGWKAETIGDDICWMKYGADGRLYAALVYATDLFDASTIARLAEHWRNLLADALRDPQQAIGDLALYSPAEQQQLAQWAEGGPLQQRALDVPARISAHAQTTPEAIAVVQGARRLSYAQLDAQAKMARFTGRPQW